MTLLGDLSLWVALLIAAWSAIATFTGGGALRRDALVTNGARAMYAVFGLVLLSSIGLWTALLGSDFSLRFVASHTTVNLPSIYKFTAFWSGLAGSLLFWPLALSLCGAIAVRANRRRERDFVRWTTGLLAVLLLALLATCAITANPFERLTWIPPEGRGLMPSLQHPAAALHQPVLSLGYAAAVVACAFAIAGFITRRADPQWLRDVRTWSLASWFLLTIAITLGLWSAYAGQSGSGAWQLDAFRNASVVPWLADTVFLGSIVVWEHRRHVVANGQWRLGGSAALVGFVLVSLAFAGNAFKQEHRVTLGAGEVFSARDPWGHGWTFTSQGVSRFAQLNRQVLAMAVRPTRDGVAFPLIRSERRQYVDALGADTFEPTNEAGVLGTIRQDVYVALIRVSEDRRADLRIAFNPLAMWAWWGGIILAFGGLIALWPRPLDREAARVVAEHDDRAEALVRQVRAAAIRCPACSALCSEPGAAYCSSCGAPLSA